ncbi:MAG: PAS domain-containing protein [Acidobacteriota bacterium]|nr:PAS domain-containing protein [Acidobacteriota bacterium]
MGSNHNSKDNLHYRHLADAMPQIVWTARPDGYVDYYNRRWFDYTGLTREKTEGWGWQPVLHPDDVERCLRRWARAIVTGASSTRSRRTANFINLRPRTETPRSLNFCAR